MIKNKNGFTLISALIALMAVCVLLIVLSQLHTVIRHISHVTSNVRHDIWLSVHQLESELLGANSISASDRTLTFQLNGDTIMYSQNGSRLVRQLNNQGFEIVLQSLSTVSFKKNGALINMTIKTEKGETYEWSFINGLN